MLANTLLRRFIPAFLAAAVPVTASAQEILYEYEGETSFQLLGTAISPAGDIDGDTVPEFLIGEPGDGAFNDFYAGRVRVQSGASGELLRLIPGDEITELFGDEVALAGDVNGDGIPDMIVGAGGEHSSAQVFSGADGTPLHRFRGDFIGSERLDAVDGLGDINADGYDDFVVGDPDRSRFYMVSGVDGALIRMVQGTAGTGWSVAGTGDLNGDGVGDVIAGSPSDNTIGVVSGAARVYSGVNGEILYEWFGDSLGDRFGVDVDCAGDVNGDTIPDLVVGANLDDPNGGGSGAGFVFSGADGALIRRFDGDSGADEFALSVAGVGDVNGDMLDDVVFGARGDDTAGDNSGSAYVYSVVDGALLHHFTGSAATARFGTGVAAAGDQDGDTVPDIVVGAPLWVSLPDGPVGRVRVFSGADGSVLLDITGTSGGADFGFSVAGLHDLTGDGRGEIAVGAPLDGAGNVAGSASIHSGSDGSVLFRFDGEAEGDRFGASVDGVGDANGDTSSDIVVGAPFDDEGGEDGGSVTLVSGLDGVHLFVIDGAAGYGLGTGVARAGDIDGDFVPDFLAGAPGDDRNGNNAGSVRAYSGATGALIFERLGFPGERLGVAVEGGQDVDGDGVPEIVVASDLANNQGRVRVLSGATGSVIHSWTGNGPGEDFGHSLAFAGDANGDGVPDVVVGAPLAVGGSGRATVFSGADGTVLFGHTEALGLGRVGSSVDGAGDVNGDGYDDIVVGARDDTDGTFGTRGTARIVSGFDGEEMFRFRGPEPGADFGDAVAGLGDLNGDGLPEFGVGAPRISSPLLGGLARVYIPCGYGDYCIAAPNSTGIPAQIDGAGTTSVGFADLELKARFLPPGQLGVFFYGADKTSATVFGDGFKCVGGATHRINPPLQIDGAGRASLLLDFGAPPVGSGPGEILAGSTWHFQFWFRDPDAGGAGFNLTDGLLATFCN